MNEDQGILEIIETIKKLQVELLKEMEGIKNEKGS